MGRPCSLRLTSYPNITFQSERQPWLEFNANSRRCKVVSASSARQPSAAPSGRNSSDNSRWFVAHTLRMGGDRFIFPFHYHQPNCSRFSETKRTTRPGPSTYRQGYRLAGYHSANYSTKINTGSNCEIGKAIITQQKRSLTEFHLVGSRLSRGTHPLPCRHALSLPHPDTIVPNGRKRYATAIVTMVGRIH